MEFDLNFFEAWDKLNESFTDLAAFLNQANPANLPANWKNYVDIEGTKNLLNQNNITNITVDTKLHWRCPECGHEWDSSIHRTSDAFRKKQRFDFVCPDCGGNKKGNNNSKGELMVGEALKQKLSYFLASNNLELAWGRHNQLKYDNYHNLDFVVVIKDTKIPVAAIQYDGDKYHDESQDSINKDAGADDSAKYNGNFFPVLRIKEANSEIYNTIAEHSYFKKPANWDNSSNPYVWFYYINYSSHGNGKTISQKILNDIISVVKTFLIQECNLVNMLNDEEQITDTEYDVIENKALLQLRGCLYKIWIEYLNNKNVRGLANDIKYYKTYNKFLDGQTPFRKKINITLYDGPVDIDYSIIPVNLIIAKNLDEVDAGKKFRNWAKQIEDEFINNKCDKASLYFSYNTSSDPNFLCWAKITMEKVNL